IWVGDARHPDRDGSIADGSVALVVTSPPYFAGKEYEAVLGVGHVPADYAAYLGMLHDVFRRCFEKLEPGGRIAVNVANLGRKPYRSLSSDVIDILERLGFLMRGEIVWQKGHAAGGSCAWGTYRRPANPVLRDVTERVVLASKGRFDRALPAEDRRQVGLPHEATVTTDEFLDATLDLWDIPAESASRVGHPAPFPVELPRRLIELFTYRDDLVYDPFMGSGSTAVAAVRTGRHFVGFDTDPGYVARALERVAEERARAEPQRGAGDGSGEGGRRRSGGGRRGRGAPPVDLGAALELRASGAKALDVAEALLRACGFCQIERGVRLRDLGLAVDFRALDAEGGVWLFEMCGAFSATRAGLRRPDLLWRTLGKAAVLHESRPHETAGRLGPLVLLTTDVPPTGSAAGRALAAAQGPDGTGPVRDVVELLDGAGAARLAAYA
ncbi:MAG TPA: site-specific DNA-methyltransferase, partial [Acidimicrobiales bacterium]|nr:site-specific DNA-methyltransferase [Acidimicrobiales bacterium]